MTLAPTALDGQALVADFHRAASHPIRTEYAAAPPRPVLTKPSTPEALAEHVLALETALQHAIERNLRASLLTEEAGELWDKFLAHDLTEVADALGDIAYVTFGAALVVGLRVRGLQGVPRRAAHMDLDLHALQVGRVVAAVADAATALLSGDQDEVHDRLRDVIDAIVLAADAMRIDIVAVFAEIHRSNMSKAWPDGLYHYREDGKVLKNAETYSPPNLPPLLLARA